MKDIIDKYVKIFKPYEGNPDNCNWYGVPNGWIKTLELLCSKIQWHCDNLKSRNKVEDDRFQVECVQVKEKFGGLRFYTNGNDEYVNGLIDMTDAICNNTCVDCGTTINVKMTNFGWVSPMCENCIKDLEFRKQFQNKVDEQTKRERRH